MKNIISTICFILFFSNTSNICFGQWVQVSNGMPSPAYVGTLTVKDNWIFAGASGSGVYFSTNNGSVWTQTTLTNHTIGTLSSNSNSVFAGASYGSYRSSDNGVTWSGMDVGSVYSFAANGNYVYAGKQNGFCLSTNNGINWPYCSLPNMGIRSVAVSGNYVFAGTVYSPSISWGLYRSTNAGYNFSYNIALKVVNTLAINGNIVYAGLSDSGGVYVSTNLGDSWLATSLNNKSIYSLTISNNIVFAGCSNYPVGYGGVYMSTNYGANWLQKNQGFNPLPSVEALIITGNYIFAGTDNGIWRRSLSEIIGVRNISTEIPDGFSLSQNYPNPFNPSTNVKFDIPKSSFVRLSIFDISGREVDVLVNERVQPGSYQVDWNASSFSSGVYFYKLTTENNSETKKMILIK